jgi:salicylate hydroxylase
LKKLSLGGYRHISYTLYFFYLSGAAMAIEDSAVLSRILSNASSLADLPTSLQDFEKQRMDRKAKVQSLSLRNLQLYHLEDGQDQRKRDGVDEFDNEEDRHQLSPIWRSVQDQHWLYGYDGGLQTVDK